MKASFKQPAEAIERAKAVEAQRMQDYAELAVFFAQAAQIDNRFEYEAQFYAKLAEQAEVGAMMALIGKARETVPAEFLAGYDTKRAAMEAERERQAAKMAEYNRFLAAQAEANKAMAEWKAIVVETENDLAAQKQAEQAYKEKCKIAAAAATDAGMDDEAFLYNFSSK